LRIEIRQVVNELPIEGRMADGQLYNLSVCNGAVRQAKQVTKHVSVIPTGESSHE